MSVKVMSLVWESDMGTLARKLIALKLADCANDKGESIYPSVSTIAKATGVSTRNVKRVLADFRAEGILRVTRKGGWRTGPSRYNMNVLKLHGVVTPCHQGGDVRSPDPSVEPRKRYGRKEGTTYPVREGRSRVAQATVDSLDDAWGAGE